MIDVRVVASGPCVILRVQHETLCVAGWLHPWLVSPGGWIWPAWCLVKEQPPRGIVCKDWGQLSAREWGGKCRSPFWVALGENGCFPPVSPCSSLPMFEKGILSADSRAVTDRRAGLRAAGKCTLLLKRKMRLDSLPNATSASLCTSVGEAEQQGGEDERTYPLTVWDPLSPFLYNSCRWFLAGRTSWKPHLQHLGGGTAVSSLWWGEEAPPHQHLRWAGRRLGSMGTGKWLHFPLYFPPPLSVVFADGIFFIFHDVSPLGNADEDVQAMMALELFLKSWICPSVNQASLTWFIWLGGRIWALYL